MSGKQEHQEREHKSFKSHERKTRGLGERKQRNFKSLGLKQESYIVKKKV